MKKIILRIILGLFALGAIYLLSLIFIFTGIGNPITRLIAEKKITEYIAEAYPDNDFEEINVCYNFKDASYGTGITSKNSLDTHFYINYNNGTIEDNYDRYVTSGFNTSSRLERKFDQYVESIFDEKIENEIELFIYDFVGNYSYSDFWKLTKGYVELDGDMAISKLNELDTQPTITIWYISEEMTFEILPEKFAEAKKLMASENIPASYYSISLRFPEEIREGRYDEHIGVHDFPSDLIGSDIFMDELKRYYDLSQSTK